ncbi:MltA domain-containing protein, partial [Mycobacterium tuberculosis]|uniref:MltA domain-containing protein n=1 Tax=Mycobacterium tuberculosis TaxID=1773 RepID=UPI001ADFEEBB
GHPFLTGYFEPELPGSRRPTPRFRVPLYRRPADLVDVADTDRATNLPADLAVARRRSDGRLVPYYTRAEIDDGALDGRGLELVYLE